MNLDPEIRARAEKIRVLLMDVDGVMTNGNLYHFPDKDGTMIETKGFDSQDGNRADVDAMEWFPHTG